MSDHYLDNLLPDFGEYSLDSLLESYQKRPAQTGEAQPEQPARAAEAIAQRSRQIVMEALGETISQRRAARKPDFDSAGLNDLLEDDIDPAGVDEPAEPKKPRVHISPEGVITVDVDLPGEGGEAAPAEEEAPAAEDMPPEEEAPAEPEAPREEKRPRRPVRRPEEPEEKPSFKDRFLTPLARYFATRAARKDLQRAEAAKWPDPDEYDQVEEVSPKKANKFYVQQVQAFGFRLKVCVFLCIVLAWISLRLPMAGLLGKSLQAQAGVSLVLLLTVMVAALDIVAAGLRQLFALQPGMESLSSLAALISALDTGI